MFAIFVGKTNGDKMLFGHEGRNAKSWPAVAKSTHAKEKSGHDRKERKEKALLPMPIVV
jgi:hypothetical protein